MVFHPLLREQDFRECVWRYEMEGERLLVKGAIADELALMATQSETRIFEAIERELLKGGDFGKRTDVVKLRYADLMGWYRKIFTPVNLLVFSHGDMHPSTLIRSFKTITKEFKWVKPNPNASTIKIP
jgi:Zn-dependent M16 (insulinase) family peptidase